MSALVEPGSMQAMGDMEGMGGMGMVWMLLCGLVALALIVLTVAAAIWLLRRAGGDPAASPEDVLRRRYAAGELDEDEYLRRRAGIKDE